MKGKNIARIVTITLLVLFMALYLTQVTGYYKPNDGGKNALTKDAIERFEDDVSKGVEIEAKNYLAEEKNYNNKLSKMRMGCSSLIGKSFDKMMNSLFNEINKAVSSK